MYMMPSRAFASSAGLEVKPPRREHRMTAALSAGVSLNTSIEPTDRPTDPRIDETKTLFLELD